MVTRDAPMNPAVETLAESLGRRAVRDAPLGAKTTYRVGGRAALLVEAADEESLVACHAALVTAGSAVPVAVIGKGSNMLVSDRGFPGSQFALVVRSVPSRSTGQR